MEAARAGMLWGWMHTGARGEGGQEPWASLGVNGVGSSCVPTLEQTFPWLPTSLP